VRFVALVISITVLLAVPATAGGPNHVVIASPTADGAQLHHSSVQVASTGADSVDSTNLAQAAPSNCTGCEGIAVAFQAVIMTGNPNTVSPRNLAVAVNSNCTGCRAFAYAYQYVVSADPGTHLSAAGRAKVADIRSRAAALVTSDLPFDQLDADLDALAMQFKAAVVDDLEHTGAAPHDGIPEADADEAPAQ
jgi:putative peptide zinc metalloprotease protein